MDGALDLYAESDENFEENFGQVSLFFILMYLAV